MTESQNDWKRIILRWIVPIILPVLVVIQSIIYFSIYETRLGYSDYGDALLFVILSGFVYSLIVLFQRSIQQPIARLSLQIGWSSIFIITVHTALIQFVDRNRAFNENDILVSFFTMVHEETNLFVAVGIILSTIGVYYWVRDIGIRERRFNSVVAAMPLGVAVIDLEGEILLHNEWLTRILEAQKKDLTGSRLFDLFNMDDLVLNSDMGIEPYGPIQLDIAFESESSPRKYLSVDIVANRDSTGRTVGHIVVVSDNTTRRQAEEEREQQRRVIELYTSLLSHDIGNDLQAVLGYIESASMVLKGNPDAAEKMLSSAEAAGFRMANLVRTFNNEASPSHIQIGDMLNDLAKDAEAINMNLTVHVDISPSVASLRSPGGTLLPIAFENLLRNSAQHAGKQPKVIIRAIKENNALVIRVTDNGPGIPKDLHKSIFYRSDPKKERGLGLYLAKQIITACDGNIELEPSDSGATFKITLPIVE